MFNARAFSTLSLCLVVVFLAACSGLPLNAKAPKVRVSEVSVKSLGLFEQVFDVGLRVSNPNNFDVTIEGLDFELEVNGRALATGLANTHTHVPALASALVNVETVTQSKNLLQQMKTLPDILKEGVPYRIHGRIKTDWTSDWLPFDHSGVYGGDEPKKDKGTAI